MPTLPDYEVYERNMIMNRHGFPQYSADPEGNTTLNLVDGIRMIQIGDIGYMEEGRFHRKKTLDLVEVLGEDPQICEKIVKFRRPEVAGSATLLDLGIGATAVVTGLPVGSSIEGELNFKRGESAVLNVESGRAIFRYCDKDTRLRLGEYMSQNYQSWLTERGLTRIQPRELILVTGTYMTTNWEVATLKESLTSISVKLSVELVNTNSFRIDWSRWTNRNQGFNSGHHHLEPALSIPMTPPSKSFEDCCHDCPRIPENQCIFLRGWRVREDFLPIPLESTIPVAWWKMLPSDIKRRLFSHTSKHGNPSRAQSSNTGGMQLPSSSERSIRGSSGSNEEMEVCSDDETVMPDIYDVVAITLTEKGEGTSVFKGPTMVHDNDVIEFMESLGELESSTGGTNNLLPSSPSSDPQLPSNLPIRTPLPSHQNVSLVPSHPPQHLRGYHFTQDMIPASGSHGALSDIPYSLKQEPAKYSTDGKYYKRKVSRNDERASEERARRRKQEEITQLRGVVNNMVPPQIYGTFLEQVGGGPKYNAGQLVEWQLINVSTKALEYYINLCESQKREITELNSKVESLQIAPRDQVNQTKSAQPQ